MEYTHHLDTEMGRLREQFLTETSRMAEVNGEEEDSTKRKASASGLNNCVEDRLEETAKHEDKVDTPEITTVKEVKEASIEIEF